MKRRFWLSVVMATVGTAMLLAAGFAAPAESKSNSEQKQERRGGTLRLDQTSDFDYIDPALAYFSHTWQLGNAVHLKLLSFPDREGAAGSRMVAQAAAGFPTVSKDGKTYTFRIKRGFKFSNGTNVTAANFAHAFRRALSPAMQSPAKSFLEDVASYRAVNATTFQVRLKVVAPDFLARMTMPFFSAVPTNIALGPADVRIRVKACALNHLDLFVREGWPGLKLPLPHVGGTDLAGVVSEVGASVSDVKVGDEVLVNPGLNFAAGPDGEQVIPPDVSIVGETRWGGLAEECVVPATHVLPKPAGLSWEEAAALPLAAITAMQMVKRKGRVKAGDKVLVVGAGGGVAVMAVQIAKALGAWVCATTGGAEKVEKVRGLGADHVIDYKADPDWSKAAFLASGKTGYDVVIDSVGQATFKGSVRSLRLGGRLVTCGATTGPLGELDLRLVFWKQLSILGSTMGVPQDLQDALQMVQSGQLRVFVDSTWPLAQVREAQAKMERSEQFGKIVLQP